jgi:hypothetical protein
MPNNYTVTATDGVSTVVKTVTAYSYIEATRTAMEDGQAYAGFDNTATLTVTTTQP